MAHLEAMQQGSALDHLQSQGQVELLDTIDRLRALGLSAQLKLPQVIVCGDTSSGKSSVLEAISEVRFPANELTCTRFASEIRLRRDENIKNTVRIKPAEGRSAAHQEYLKAFGEGVEFTDVREIPAQIEKATEHLDKVKLQGDFFRDILVAEIHGPDRPSLTLVDLPGFIHASSNEDNTDIATVREIVDSYMRQPNTIILAVIDANNEWINQIVLNCIKPHGATGRTLGIMTKLDMFTSGSRRGIRAIQCARTGKNDFVSLKYGWHMLRNRDFESDHISFDERNAREAEFFAKDGWNDVPEDKRGSATLRDKVSKMLLNEIRTNLPTIIQDIQSSIRGCDKQAALLGKPNSTEADMRQQLGEVSQELHKLIDAATRGDYTSSPFFRQTGEAISPRRLRACLRNFLGEFAADMHKGGMRFCCVEGKEHATAEKLDLCAPSDCLPDWPIGITRQCVQRDLEEYFRHNLGTEVSGKLPISTYGSILSFQCSRWDTLATEAAHRSLGIAKECFSKALTRSSPAHVAAAVQKHIVEPHFDRAQAKVLTKVQEILRPYTAGGFSMLNELELEWKEVKSSGYAWDRRTLQPLEPEAQDESTAELCAVNDVVEWLDRAYPIALNTFLDNFANLAIEFCLVEDLHALFTPIDIMRMDMAQVEALTREPEKVVQLRLNNDAELEALREALEVCTRHSNGLGAYPVSTPRRESSPPSAATPRTPEDGAVNAERVAEVLEPPSASPPSAAAASASAEAPGTAKKSRSQAMGSDPITWTPPVTPPRDAAGDRLSLQPDGQAGRGGSVRRAQRKERGSQAGSAASHSRSPSPLAVGYGEPSHDVFAASTGSS